MTISRMSDVLRVLNSIPMVAVAIFVSLSCSADEPLGRTSPRSSIGPEGLGWIVVEAHGQLPKLPVIFTADAEANVDINDRQVSQVIEINAEVIQGEATTLSFEIGGQGNIESVEGSERGLHSWSVRQLNQSRCLDIHLHAGVKKVDAKVVATLDLSKMRLPIAIDLLHLKRGDATEFSSSVLFKFDDSVEGIVSEATGFFASPMDDDLNVYRTNTGGKLSIDLNRRGTAPPAVAWVDTSLDGRTSEDGRSIDFEFRGTAIVNQANALAMVLAGNAAVSEMPPSDQYRLRLSTNDESHQYEVQFGEPGEYPVNLRFVAPTMVRADGRRGSNFIVASGAVVPLTIRGLPTDIEFFQNEQSIAESIVPTIQGDAWTGFLPASGRVDLQWKQARKANDGNLFFSTSGTIEAKIGVGLLRQQHRIVYKPLQGELSSLAMLLRGPGEILDVDCNGMVAWKVTDQGDQRLLTITMGQSFTGKRVVNVRSQTTLEAFPVEVEGLRLEPVDTIRHAGFLRIQNVGSVRLEPIDLSGLTQLSPEQFPGESTDARQVFVYRFPSAKHGFSISADRIEPEINVSQLVRYQLAESDRTILADIELDIRESNIRQWEMNIPSDYSIVSVTGAKVADYITSEQDGGLHRRLQVVFGSDVIGRQLINLHLEKNVTAVTGNWVLPKIEYPGAKTVRGNIGLVGAAGFRISVEEASLLVEKPLSSFPKPTRGLQQSFRIRETDWSATMRVDLLQRNIQSDVFHLYSLSQETVYGSAILNYFVTGAPVTQLEIKVPTTLANVMVDGQDIRTWRRDGEILIVSLHQPVMGAYTLLITFEEKTKDNAGVLKAAQVMPLQVQGERGYIQIVSPMQVETKTIAISDEMLALDPLELPAEFRLLSTAPSLGTWQYTERPLRLEVGIEWFQPGSTLSQLVEFSEANSRVSRDGELVTDVLYYVKSRGQRTFKIRLPETPVRLWEVSVDGQVVTARQAGDETLIPLPGGTDPNLPNEVRLRLGKPTVNQSLPELMLPIVDVPILKTQWEIIGDDQYLLIPDGGTHMPSEPVVKFLGFHWVAKHGLIPLMGIVIFALIGVWACGINQRWRWFGLMSFAIAIFLSLSTAMMAVDWIHTTAPLRLNVPILAAGETTAITVHHLPKWRADLSIVGILVGLGGILFVGWSYLKIASTMTMLGRGLGVWLIAVGILWQGGGAPWFYFVLAIAISLLLLFKPAKDSLMHLGTRLNRPGTSGKKKVDDVEDASPIVPGGTVPAALICLSLGISCWAVSVPADAAERFSSADSIIQSWEIDRGDSRLTATGTIVVPSVAGSQFVLLKSPAVLTQFEGDGLQVFRTEVAGEGLVYVVSVDQSEQGLKHAHDETDNGDQEEIGDLAAKSPAQFKATFRYQIEGVDLLGGVAVLTGAAAVRRIEVMYEKAGWEVESSAAVRIEDRSSNEDSTRANVLLGPGEARLTLRPKPRNVVAEQTRFFVEAANLYMPSPGVIDGRHRLSLRTSQGQIRDLEIEIPNGLTVSTVDGPVGSWQFDAELGRLKLNFEPAQSKPFDLLVETQRGLESLPTNATLSPLRVVPSHDDHLGGEVGMLAVAFGPDAQPETFQPTGMSAVNIADFDTKLLSDSEATVRGVYRYGSERCDLKLRLTPVEPEVRVTSKQILSLGDERVVMAIEFTAEITRAGLFQLSFPLPLGMEVESLTGDSLHHWAESTEGDRRQIILHLNGKTIGEKRFSLGLAGASPGDVAQWSIPRFELAEADRQTGDLAIRPTTGIRLRTISRKNVSETDPRTIGGQGEGALAFRLLQRDWDLLLGIEKLDPWITGAILHEITLREGQTRTRVMADLNVENASIRDLQIILPTTSEEEVKTLRASGEIVSDFIRTAPDSSVWKIQFKRRVIGKVQFQIEFEKRGERINDRELLRTLELPQTRQLSYHFAVRAGGRLELEHDVLGKDEMGQSELNKGELSKGDLGKSDLGDGWQRADWNAVSQSLRNAGNRAAPAITLRAVNPDQPIQIRVKRHALAAALKLRVAAAALTTVLSPTGDQMTAVDLTMDVIQRSSLTVNLPPNGDLMNIFVNGESVHSIRLDEKGNVWQFYVLSGVEDSAANVRFVYSVNGEDRRGGANLRDVHLASPQLNVPLENIQWNVIAPVGFNLRESNGNLELKSKKKERNYDLSSYLSLASSMRTVRAKQAEKLLEKANKMLRDGEQDKAKRALSNVTNRFALDAASNEDARVQLENLQTQQAIVGLNTRRQRIYLDNKVNDATIIDNQQLRHAAATNPILMQNDLNFRPQQFSQLLGGNSVDENAVLQQIAARLVHHQHTTEPAPQAILINLPEEGSVFTFDRSVQVQEESILSLMLDFESQRHVSVFATAAMMVLLASLATVLAFASTTKKVN